MPLPDTKYLPGRFRMSDETEEDHEEFTDRLRKSLYYGSLPTTDRPSLPLTNIAVGFFQDAAPRELGKLDTYFASSSSRSACMSPTSMVMGMTYVKRLREKNPNYLHQISSSELFLISMMMASKFLYDEGVDDEVFNDEWAESSDIDLEDMNQLEREFLSAIDWQLFVNPEDFADLLNKIEKRIALQEGLSRGWFSYTDLWLLSDDLNLLPWNYLVAELSKVMSVSYLAYIAGILTMIGSTVLVTTATTSLAALRPLTSVTIDTGLLPLPVSNDVNIGISTQDLDADIVNMSQEEVKDTSGLLQSKVMIEVGGRTAFSRKPNIETSQFSRNCSEPPKVQIADQTEIYHATAFDLDTTSDLETNNNEQTDTNQAQPGSLWNNLLPPLFALMTLKESVIDFVQAVKGTKVSTGINDLDPMTDDPFMTQICSKGPCKMESWPDCWNTSGSDWSGVKIAEMRRCSESFDRQRCSTMHGCEDWSTEVREIGNVMARTGHSQLPFDHCCCNVRQQNGQVVDKTRMKGRFADLSLGFSTGSYFTMLVTA